MIRKNVCVEPFDQESNTIAASPGCARSALFRDSLLPIVLSSAIRQHTRRKETAPFQAIVMGSSYGPEVDSITSLLAGWRIRSASITGIDADPDMIALAEAGTYSYAPDCDPQGLRRPLSDWRLRAAGFKVEKSPTGNAVISAAALRQRYNVKFKVEDITEKPEMPTQADLVTCHNVLPHITYHDTEAATRALGVLAARTRPGGILSLVNHQVMFERDFAPYAEWYDTSTEPIRQQHNLRPLDYEVAGRQVVFQKDA